MSKSEKNRILFKYNHDHKYILIKNPYVKSFFFIFRKFSCKELMIS